LSPRATSIAASRSFANSSSSLATAVVQASKPAWMVWTAFRSSASGAALRALASSPCTLSIRSAICCSNFASPVMRKPRSSLAVAFASFAAEASAAAYGALCVATRSFAPFTLENELSWSWPSPSTTSTRAPKPALERREPRIRGALGHFRFAC
jgi:hypothetical protein